ncbi:MAG TPA: phospholipid carrier-dependent glycosyltransferase [Gemmatimonadaceae bacterium]
MELLLVTALAALTRLWALFSPHAVVFDEVHTLRFVRAYLTGTPYFDVHPPLAVQLFALVARLLGVDAAAIDAGAPVAMRILPALVGTLLVPLVWLLVRRAGGSRRAAFLGAALVALDNAMVVQSRFMLPDVLLVAFGIAAVVTWLGGRAAAGDASGDAPPVRWVRLVGAGVLAGMAMAVKWTGLSALGLIVAVELWEGVRGRRRLRAAIWRALATGAAAVTTYLLVFAVHLHRFAGSGGFFPRLLRLHEAMLAGDRELEGARHFYSSPWYSWPLLVRPIHYWMESPDAQGRAADIYLLGNPLIWWGSTVTVLLYLVSRTRRREPGAGGADLMAAGWAINVLPFAAIARLMYLYHYLHALTFAIALGALWLGARLAWRDDEPTWRLSRAPRDLAFWGILAAALVLFLFFAPVTYGWRLSPAALQLRLWLPGWG